MKQLWEVPLSGKAIFFAKKPSLGVRSHNGMQHSICSFGKLLLHICFGTSTALFIIKNYSHAKERLALLRDAHKISMSFSTCLLIQSLHQNVAFTILLSLKIFLSLISAWFRWKPEGRNSSSQRSVSSPLSEGYSSRSDELLIT